MDNKNGQKLTGFPNRGLKKVCTQEPEFLSVSNGQLFDNAGKMDSIPPDIPCTEYFNYGMSVFFDFTIKNIL